MLNEGIITPNTSLFSSRIILIKKKDGTWRWDIFPIPMVDELINELFEANTSKKKNTFYIGSRGYFMSVLEPTLKVVHFLRRFYNRRCMCIYYMLVYVGSTV